MNVMPTGRRVRHGGGLIGSAGYTVAAAVSTMLVNAVLISVLPAHLSVREYGYLQMYLFYSSYVGLLHLGWVDGIYLRYGGASLHSIARATFSAEMLLFVIFQLATGAVLGSVGLAVSGHGAVRSVVIAVAVCLVVTNIRFAFLYLLQATANFRAFAIATVCDRGAFLLAIWVLFSTDTLNLNSSLVADLACKSISLVVGVLACIPAIGVPSWQWTHIGREIWSNVTVGSQLMIANLASAFLVGVNRLAVQAFWSVEVFAQVSMALGVTVVGVTLVNSVGFALFPYFRRTDVPRLQSSFVAMREILSVLLLVCLLFYIPLSSLIGQLLPDYEPSVKLLGILLPLMVFEGRMALLVNPLMKALRMEGFMLRLGVGSLGLSAISALVGGYLVHSIAMVLFGMVVVLGLRAVISERAVARRLDVALRPLLIFEFALAVCFSVEVWLRSGALSVPWFSLIVVGLYGLLRSRVVVRSVRDLGGKGGSSDLRVGSDV